MSIGVSLSTWNVPESALPAGASVLFRQPSFWQRYERYIIAAVVLILLQAVLIAGLLWQRARKRAVTADLRRLGGHLIHAQEEERARASRVSFTTTSASAWQFKALSLHNWRRTFLFCKLRIGPGHYSC